MLPSQPIRRIQAERRRRAISWSDRFVLFVPTRAPLQGRAGFGWRRDASAFPGERERFTRLNDEGSGRLREMAASTCRRQTVSPRSNSFAPDIMFPYTPPDEVFEKAAVRAVKKFRYNARRQVGNPAATEGVVATITFTHPDDLEPNVCPDQREPKLLPDEELEKWSTTESYGKAIDLLPHFSSDHFGILSRACFYCPPLSGTQRVDENCLH